MHQRTSYGNFKITMQVHSRFGFPQILHGSKQEDEETSISLKPGHEYEIKLDPYGRISTTDFDELPFEKQQCKLSHEIHSTATHPNYTFTNCKFDCYVNLAFETCKCIPWGFVNKHENAPDCEIFGRTCFYNMIGALTHRSDQNCTHCVEECNYIHYRRNVKKTEKFQWEIRFQTRNTAISMFASILQSGTNAQCHDY